MDIKKIISSLNLIIVPVLLYAQLTGYNSTEFQYGNIPGFEPKDRNTLFNQFNVSYRTNDVKAKLRLEQFYSSDSISKDYFVLSQANVTYQIDKLKVSVGNMNESLGRGLLLRSYEITGSVFEDYQYRTKYTLNRDLLGVSTAYEGKVLRIKAMHGKMLNNEYPPGYDERRIDFISAFSSSLDLFKQRLGANILRLDLLGETSFYTSAFFEGILPFEISYYTEYAYGFDSGIGIYSSISKSFNKLGLSLEYKKYDDLFIGSGLSDPPNLVKEHSYKLLNRSTHILNPINEEGYQVELYYTFPNLSVLTLNNSYAVNHLYDIDEFYEYFAEYYFPIGISSSVKTFFDWSKSDVNNEKQRLSAGTNMALYLKKGFSGIIDFQVQNIQREFVDGSTQDLNNVLWSISLHKSNKYAVTLLHEITTDPWLADDFSTEKVETLRHFPGIALGYKPSSRINFILFAGRRRGGPACNSGICYEVLDFEGIELKIISKF